MIGGAATVAASSVEAAPIKPDGSLGDFAPAGKLTTDCTSAPSFVIGGALYVVGGGSNASIEAAPIHSDGTLGMFAVVTGASLPIAQAGGSCIAAVSRI